MLLQKAHIILGYPCIHAGPPCLPRIQWSQEALLCVDGLLAGALHFALAHLPCELR